MLSASSLGYLHSASNHTHLMCVYHVEANAGTNNLLPLSDKATDRGSIKNDLHVQSFSFTAVIFCLKLEFWSHYKFTAYKVSVTKKHACFICEGFCYVV